MTPATFDERARAQTRSLLSDATRIPTRFPLDHRTSAPWRVIAIFAATVLLISAAVVGASIALRGSTVTKPAPASRFGHWKAFQLVPNGGNSPDAISCPDAHHCVAVNYDGDVIVSTDPGGGSAAWTMTLVDPIATLAGESPQIMTGVSCADPRLCVAVDQAGNVVTSTNPGGGAAAWIVSGVDGQASLNGISCPAEQLCVAVGGLSANGYPAGVVLTSTNPAGGPGTWTAVDLNNDTLTAVSCPSPSLCVATDANGDILTSTDPTGGARAWSSVGVDMGSNSPSAISCPSAALCVAVDPEGNVMTSTDPTGGGGAWTLTSISADITRLPNFDSVSCAGATLCVIGTQSDHVYMSTDPTAGSGAWIPVRVIPQGEAAMFGLSCPNNRFCVGVDGSAGVHVYTGPG